MRATVTSSPALSEYDGRQLLDAISDFDYLLILAPATLRTSDHPALSALGLQPNLLMRIKRDEQGGIMVRPAAP